MSLAQQMKREMTARDRPGAAAETFEEQLAALPPSDRAEVERFAAFLQDTPTMNTLQLIEKHGADYLGFKPAEIAVLKANAAKVDDGSA